MATRLRPSYALLALGTLALSADIALAGNVHRAVVTRVSPVYPELARRMHVSGKVVLLVEVQPDGSVSSTKVESGHALLAPAAEDAVHRWRFAPYSEASESEIEVNFSADGGQ